MKFTISKLWHDDTGAIITAEYLFLVTILVIGVIVGLTHLREAITVELTELGNALLALSQGFDIYGSSSPFGGFDGSGSFDTPSNLFPPVPVPPSFPSDIDVFPNKYTRLRDQDFPSRSND